MNRPTAQKFFSKLSKPFLTLLAVGVLVGSVYLVINLAQKFLEGLALKEIEANLAPDFVLKDLSGRDVKLSNFRGNKVILNFWTSWNEVSLEQLSIFKEYYQAPHNDLVILTINSQEESDMINSIIKSQNFQLPVLLDSEGEVGEFYDISVLPLTIFISKAGFEINRVLGLMPLDELLQQVDKL